MEKEEKQFDSEAFYNKMRERVRYSFGEHGVREFDKAVDEEIKRLEKTKTS